MEFSAAYRTVACFPSSAEAEAVRAQLAAEGIAAAVHDATASAASRDEAVRVLVPVSDLDRARGLLAPQAAPAGAPATSDARPAGGAGAWQAALTTVGLLIFAAAVALLLSFF